VSAVRLFVYGSLRSDLGDLRPRQSAKAFAFLAASATSEGAAWVSGRLFAPAWYPGLVPGPAGQVRGEVWRLTSDAAFGQLDAFEGEAYRRDMIEARREDGRRVTTHTYRYAADLTGVSEIASGDYLEWVRSLPRT
jgi:gamma-glutamylcyclotransferase (GGCT)/AIG2-like uncharacterized protein YtfP